MLQKVFVFGLCFFWTVLSINNIGYQIHSNNDLGEIRQTLLKGARYFKLDPHYVDDETACNTSSGCLLLNHDKPLVGLSKYDSTNDLLAFFNSSEFNFLSNKETVVVALCFKSAPEKCKNTTSFNKWLNLVDDFYSKALVMMPGVQIVLDGDGKPQNCLAEKWPAWKSVWIKTDGPADAFYSDDETQGFDRFQVLNNPENVIDWTWMAQPEVDYGKFTNSTYPYQLWEPDSQTDFQEYIAIYKGGKKHEPGYNFAINIDMAMFWIYTAGDANFTHPAINQLLPTFSSTFDGPMFIRAVSESILLVLSTEAAAEISYSIVTIDESTSKASSIGKQALPSEITSWLSTNDESLIQALILSAHEAIVEQSAMFSFSVLLTSSSGRVAVIELSVPSASQLPIITSITTGTIPLQRLLDVESVEVTDGGAKQGQATLFVLSDGDSTEGSLILSSVVLNSSASRSTIDAAVSTLAVLTIAEDVRQSFRRAEGTGGSLSPKPIAVGRLASLRESDGSNTFLVFYSSDDVIKGTVISLPDVQTSKDRQAVTKNAATNPRWVQLTVGRNFDLSMTARKDFLMLVTDYGYCYNSHVHNTRAVPRVCSSTPAATAKVLDYSFGLTSDWRRLLTSSDCTLTTATQAGLTPVTPVTPPSTTGSAGGLGWFISGADVCFAVDSCNERIMHGSYDQGSRPAVAMVTVASSGAPAFFELHRGLSPSARAEGQCGEPLHRDGLIVDSFDVSGWAKSLQRTAAVF